MPESVVYPTKQDADAAAALVSTALDYPQCGALNGTVIGRIAPHGCTGDGRGPNFAPGCPHQTWRQTAPEPSPGGQWSLPVDAVMAETPAVLAAVPEVSAREMSMTINIRQYVAPSDGADLAPAFGRLATASVRGSVFIPAGAWVLGSPVVIQCNAGISLVGEGADATRITVTHQGVGITMDAPVNASTAGHYSLRDFALIAAPGVHGLACGVVDIGATYPYFSGLSFDGFKYGLELRQSELADVDRCDFEMTAASTIGLLITEAAYTNRISVARCQFNGGGDTSTGIADNGGACHSFRDVNLNGLYTGIRIAGVQTGVIEMVECEGTYGPVCFLATDHLGNQGTGQCGNVTVRNSFFACTGPNDAPLRIDSAGRIRFDSSQVAMATVGILGSHNSPQILTDGQVYGTGQPFTLLG